MSGEFTIEEVRAELARFTYKPGWSLTLDIVPVSPHLLATWAYQHGSRFFELRLNIDIEADDSRNPGQRTMVRAHYAVPPLGFVGFPFAAWLMDVLLETERHEMREWLRRDGALVDDPHA